MSCPRLCRVLSFALLLSALAACGDDDVTPPPGTDGGTTDAGRRDGSADGGGSGVDGGACTDEDGDGHGAVPCGDDCDDADATRFPGNTETCDADDDDCDDSTYGHDADADADGFASVLCCNGTDNCGADCDDGAVNANPDADEICNGGIDDDCNGSADSSDGVCVPCASGYTGFDGECADIDECLGGAPCGGAAGASCANTSGSYACTCPTGYVGPALGGTCADIDDCVVGTCGVGVATCTNSVGSYACTCARGYRTAAPSGAPCVDIDECTAGMPCGPDGTCSNLSGSYLCACRAGYGVPAAGGPCADLDECALATDDCDDSPAATCTNTTGSFTCTCPPNFGGAGHGASGCAGPRFTDLGDGTVRDNNGSGLEWQQTFSAAMSYAAIVTYCATLALDGGGWRMPTLDELGSIADSSRSSPTIDLTFFPGTPSSPSVGFWSSTAPPGSLDQRWVVFFEVAATVAPIDVASSHRARCVR